MKTCDLAIFNPFSTDVELVLFRFPLLILNRSEHFNQRYIGPEPEKLVLSFNQQIAGFS